MTMPTTDYFTLGLIQMSMSNDKATNLAKACDRVREAAKLGAEIVCLPELFLTPYFCQSEDYTVFDLAEPIPSPTSQALGALAKETGVVLAASLFEKRMPGVYHNTSIVYEKNGESLGLYRKMHIPDDPLYYEKYYFTPGDLGFRSFDTSYGKVGTLVCWDQWYPEAARLTAMKGAEVLIYPTAIGWHPKEKAEYGEVQHSAWEVSQRGHAVANGIYVAAINRVGHEGAADGGIQFWGGSFVADPSGTILAKASFDKEEILIVKCDRKRIEFVRRNWPFFRDRRIDAYSGITARVSD